jgi:hypothetical protein
MLREMERPKPTRPTIPELMQTLVMPGYDNLVAELGDLDDGKRGLRLHHGASLAERFAIDAHGGNQVSRLKFGEEPRACAPVVDTFSGRTRAAARRPAPRHDRRRL